MEQSELEGLSVPELRRLLRENHPECRGVFATSASKADCTSILLGHRKADDVMREWMLAEMPEGVGGENPPKGESKSHGVTNEDGVDEDVIMSLADDAASILDAVKQPAMRDAVRFLRGNRDGLKLRVDDLLATLEDRDKTLADTAAELESVRSMRIKESAPFEPLDGGKVGIAGVNYEVVQPATLDDGTVNPLMADVPAADRYFDFDAWRAISKHGAMEFEATATDLFTLIRHGVRTALFGPPSVGKTTVIEQFAAHTQWPVVRFQGHRDKTLDSFVGAYEARDGRTVWVDGPLVRAMRIGAIFLFDEFNRSTAEVTDTMHPVMEPNGALLIDATGEIVKPHANFRIVLGGNGSFFGDEDGLHPSLHVQDSATISRIDAVFSVTWPTRESEQSILVSRTGVSPKQAELVTELATATREAVAAETLMYAMTLRHTLAVCDLMTTHKMTVGKALALAVLSKAPKSDAGALAEMAQRVFGDAFDGRVIDE